jgi:hypothetical protein
MPVEYCPQSIQVIATMKRRSKCATYHPLLFLFFLFSSVRVLGGSKRSNSECFAILPSSCVVIASVLKFNQFSLLSVTPPGSKLSPGRRTNECYAMLLEVTPYRMAYLNFAPDFRRSDFRPLPSLCKHEGCRALVFKMRGGNVRKVKTAEN